RDELARFRPAIVAVRWGTVGVGVVLAAADIHDNNATTALWCALVIAYAAVRTIWPLRADADLRSAVGIVAEVALHVIVVVSTGYWDSPFVFSLITAIIIAGFSRGFVFSLAVAIVSVVAVSIPEYLQTDNPEWRVGAQWAAEMVLIALV